MITVELDNFSLKEICHKNRNKETMTTEEKLDETDIRILKLLQQNSRLTVKELVQYKKQKIFIIPV